MHPRHVAAFGLLLVAAASLQWGTLAFPSAANIFAPLWLEAGALVIAAWGIARAAGGAAAVGFGLAAVAQVAFFALFALGSLGADDWILGGLTTLGYAAAGWAFVRGGGLADARAGIALGAASMVLSTTLDLASGSTFLLVGYALAVPGWLLATGAAWGWLAPAPARAASA